MSVMLPQCNFATFLFVCFTDATSDSQTRPDCSGLTWHWQPEKNRLRKEKSLQGIMSLQCAFSWILMDTTIKHRESLLLNQGFKYQMYANKDT